jgi:hypothetical protein
MPELPLCHWAFLTESLMNDSSGDTHEQINHR